MSKQHQFDHAMTSAGNAALVWKKLALALDEDRDFPALVKDVFHGEVSSYASPGEIEQLRGEIVALLKAFAAERIAQQEAAIDALNELGGSFIEGSLAPSLKEEISKYRQQLLERVVAV